MSRMDDELRKAFKRQQPPVDFTARVLERVARQPEPRPSWWRRLAAIVEPPKLRWVAIGATAALLLAIGATQWSRLNQKVVTDNGPGKVSEVVAPSSQTDDRATGQAAGKQRIEQPRPDLQPERRIRRAPHRSELAAARLKQDRELKAEAEAAKEKLMLALSIASSTLNNAQKAVHDDGPKP